MESGKKHNMDWQKRSGFILVDKPSGMTSNDVNNYIKMASGIKKSGYAGTLDPIASGLMVFAIGREATKRINKFAAADKEYIAKIKLGRASDTFDRQGKIIPINFSKIPPIEKIKEVLDGFIGEIEQTPPIFSAKKVNGKKLYQLARKGEKVFIKPEKINIKKINLLAYQWPYLKIKVLISSGGYLRSLANDIGRKLGVGGYIDELRRIKIGDYHVEQAIEMEKINNKNWQNFLFEI